MTGLVNSSQKFGHVRTTLNQSGIRFIWGQIKSINKSMMDELINHFFKFIFCGNFMVGPKLAGKGLFFDDSLKVYLLLSCVDESPRIKIV